MERIILNFEGGPAEALAVGWLARAHRAEVVTVTIDRGQPGDLEPVRDQALAAGAARAHVLEAREMLATEYLLPALQAGVLDDAPQLAIDLSAPLVGRLLVEVAAMEGAGAVAHLSDTPPGRPDAVVAAVAALAPSLRVITLDAASITAALAGDQACGPASSPMVPDVAGNLWAHRVVVPPEIGPDPGARVFVLTEDPAGAPAEGASLDIDFERGVPAAVNGVPVPLVELLEIVATIAGDHGVGRSECRRLDEAGVRVFYESPAGTVLTRAHAALEGAVTDDDTRAIKRLCALAYRDLLMRAAWGSPARAAIDALVARVQAGVSGTVRLTLSRGACQVTGTRRLPGRESAAGVVAGATAPTAQRSS